MYAFTVYNMSESISIFWYFTIICLLCSAGACSEDLCRVFLRNIPNKCFPFTRQCSLPETREGEGPNKRASAHFGNQSISVYILVTSQLIGFLLPSPLLFPVQTSTFSSPLLLCCSHPNTCKKNLTHTFTIIDSTRHTTPCCNGFNFVMPFFALSLCLKSIFSVELSFVFWPPPHTLINLFFLS